MSNELIGTSHKYIIDKSYGINQDGFIAVGTESFVYKGLELKGDMAFSCVLKFRPRKIRVDGQIIDRFHMFMAEEWKIFDSLRECRSVVKINDVIEDMGDFSVQCGQAPGGIINKEGYFCIIEEFIDGWNLDEFCRNEYWKLRQIMPLDNGLSKAVDYWDFSETEKKAVQSSYNYENILKYQNQILLFMINLCEIMQFVTEQKYILHLDIKPENIMVTRYGKELVLIDFGRSEKITKAKRFVLKELPAVDYGTTEKIDRLYQHGTLGYAAPECYAKSANGTDFPFHQEVNHGLMSVESDIFSIGATFWECFNIYELVTGNKKFSANSHDFYQEYFLNDETYTDRDLSCTSKFYHKMIENILKKCTRRRESDYTNQENRNYYHSYSELKRDIELAKDSAPTVVKEENIKAKNAFCMCGVMLSCALIFMMIYGVYRLRAFDIAQSKWENLTVEYNDTQFYRLEEIADDLIETANSAQIDDSYDKIAAFTYQENEISEYEVEMLVELLQKVDNSDLLPERIDEIMKHADSRKYKEISASIIKLGDVDGSEGYEIARAIFNVEVSKTDIVEAYEILEKYQNDTDFQSAVVKLKNCLDNDEYIRQIADDKGLTRKDIQKFFEDITLEVSAK